MRHFIFEDKDYEINPEYKNVSKDKTRTALQLGALYGLYRMKSRNGRSYSGGGGSSSGGSGSKTYDRRQNCTVKTHYSYSMAAHKEQIEQYLQREGAGKDGEKPVLFGTELEKYKENMVGKNFRIFLSPGKTDISQQVLARTFMKKLELQTGYKFNWLAASHYNTAHPHTHLLINGIDLNGQDVYFSRDLIKTIMRDTARDICTSLAGYRTREQIHKEKENSLISNRYTIVDRNLAEHVKDYQVFPPAIEKNNEMYLKRINHLEKLGLCKWEDNVYKFVPEWQETLKTIGRYNMFLDAKRKLHYTDKNRYHLYNYDFGQVAGIVTQIYKTDDVSDNHAAVLEGIDGKAYFIPLFYKPKFQKGDTISVTPKENQKGRLTPFVEDVSEKTLSKMAESFDVAVGKGYGAFINNKNDIERD